MNNDLRFKAYGFRFLEKDHKLIENMIQYIDKTASFEILDLRSYAIETCSSDIVLLFGKQAVAKFKGHNARLSVELPQIINLHKGNPKNKETRKIALDTLSTLKENLSSLKLDTKIEKINNNIVSINDLPDMDPEQIQGLKKILKKQGIKSWLGTSVSGKQIKLTLESEPNNGIAQITFDELYMLKIFKDQFNLKEVKFEYTDHDNKIGSNNSSSRKNI